MSRSTQIRSSEVRAIAGATMYAAFTVLPLFLTGTLAIAMRGDLDFGTPRVGVAAAIFTASSAISSIPGGNLTERLGGRWATRISSALAIACMAGTALFATSWWGLVTFLVAGGAANGIAQPMTNAVVANSVDPSRQGVAFGIKRSSFSLAGVLAGLAAIIVATQDVDWRTVWTVTAIATAFLALLVPSPATAATQINRVSRPRLKGPLRRLALASGLAMGAIGSMEVYFVESTVRTGVSLSTAGLLFTIGAALGVATRLFVGVAADRRPTNVLVASSVLILVGALGFIAIGFGETLPLIGIGAALAFGAGSGWTGLFIFGVVAMNREAPGAASGRIDAGMSTGAVIGPLLFGAFIASGSFAGAWLVGIASLVLAAALIAQSSRQAALTAPRL